LFFYEDRLFLPVFLAKGTLNISLTNLSNMIKSSLCKWGSWVSPWLLVAIISCLACGSTKREEACTLELSAPSSTIAEGALSFKLEIAVLKGKCRLADYILKAENKEMFSDDNWSTREKDEKKQTLLAGGQDEKTLKDWLDTEKSDLHQGERKKITITIKPNGDNKSSIFSFSILDKKKQLVEGPLEIKWTTA
jgi:hypothetical protein